MHLFRLGATRPQTALRTDTVVATRHVARPGPGTAGDKAASDEAAALDASFVLSDPLST